MPPERLLSGHSRAAWPILGPLATLMLLLGAALCAGHARVDNAQSPATTSVEDTEFAIHDRFVLGRRPFATHSSWNIPISATAAFAPINWPASTGYNYGVTWSNYSPRVYLSSGSDPLVTVTYPPGWGYKGGALPVRMPLAADGAAGTDGELIVIENDIVHNFWQFTRLSPTNASAKSYGAAHALTSTGWGSRRPLLGAGIVAAGASQLAGLLVQAETDRGEIEHALQLTVDAVLVKPGFTGDAISGDGKSPDGILQIGERLAIPRGTQMPSGLSPLGQKVFRAYLSYGVFVIDVAGGSTNLRAQANAYDPKTVALLQRDLLTLTPMLQRIR